MGRLTAICAAGLLALACAGCGGEEDLARSGPGEAQVEVLDDLYGGRYDLAWEDLHPAHQQIAPRSLFVRCGLADTDPAFPRYPPLPVRTCPGWKPDEEG